MNFLTTAIESMSPINNDTITCLVMRKSENKFCYIGKYCPQFHGEKSQYNAVLDVYYSSSFNQQMTGPSLSVYDEQLVPATTVPIFQSSCNYLNQEMFWIDGKRIIGCEAETVFSFFLSL